MTSRNVRMLNRHGYYLEVLKTGEIKGTSVENSPYGKCILWKSFKRNYVNYVFQSLNSSSQAWEYRIYFGWAFPIKNFQKLLIILRSNSLDMNSQFIDFFEQRSHVSCVVSLIIHDHMYSFSCDTVKFGN